MSIEVLPLGVKCSLACTYCYQDPIRKAGNALAPDYDMDAMKAALLKEGYRFTIFGGEPLLVPIDDLEELWRWGQEKFGASAAKDGASPNGVQTHGAEMTDAHILLFQKYGVGVGISVDGPGELNDARWAGSLERTRAATERTHKNLHRLLDIGHIPSIIVTLHQLNASTERLPQLLEWFRMLATRGLRHINLHLLEVDAPGVREKLSLSVEENVNALWACYQLQQEVALQINPLRDMEALLLGNDQRVNCTWNACDPYTTNAVHGVDGQGNRGNCGRTCKEGPFWIKADQAGYERYLSLYYTPQQHGGCQGCPVFFACKGNCPGEGPQGDWRGKTEHCATLLEVFHRLEERLLAQGKKPLSRSPQRAVIEKRLIDAWSVGQNISINRALAGEPSYVQDRPHGDAPHGDHTDVAKPVVNHGDHTDLGGL